MKKSTWLMILSLLFWCQSIPGFAAGDNEAVITAVQQEISKRAGAVGTLNVYDAKLNSVRNLKVMEVQKDVIKTPNGYTVMLNAHDSTRSEDVSVAVNVKETNGALTVADFELGKITEKKADANKEYTDAEIQSLMNTYLQTQAKFTGHLMLFDEDSKKMRNLDLVKLDPEVRRMGILSISRAEYKDADSKETLGIDVTVENKAGQLSVQSLRIREVKK